MVQYAIIKKYYTINLNSGEQQTVDLPPVNPGQIEVRLLTHPGNPHTIPPTPPDGPGPHVQIGLFYKGRGTMNAPQLPLHNVTSAATTADNFWQLKIKNTNDEPEGSKRFSALVLYPGPNPILTRTIPLSFFQRSFDNFWNQYRPIENIQLNYEHDDDMDGSINMFGQIIKLYSTKLILTLKQEIADLYKGEISKSLHLKRNVAKKIIPLKIDVPHMDNDIEVRFHDLNITSIRINVVHGTAFPAISVTAAIESAGPAEISAHWNVVVGSVNKSLDFSSITFQSQITLTTVAPINDDGLAVGEKHLFFVVNTGFHVAPTFYIDYGFGTYDISAHAEEKVRNTVNELISKALNDKVNKVIGFLLGEQYPILDLKCVNDSIVIQYIGNPAFEDFNIVFVKPFTPPPNLAKIDHIVVLMMENRSFDHMLGYLKLEEGRQDIDGLTGTEFNLDPNGRKILVNHLTDTQIDESPCHETMCVAYQSEGRTMKGFVTNFAARYPNLPGKWNEVMGYYNKHEVPTFHYLANEFAVMDRWFCAHPGPTLPNRFVTYTGKLDKDKFGRVVYDNYDFSTFTPIETPTIFEYLTRYGISWKVFEHGYSFIRAFTRHTFDTTNVLPIENEQTGFYSLARQGRLPSVSFIEPDYIDVPPGNDDHPPADITNGQSLISRIVKALQESPQWEKTLFIVTYDEHGGFYDHVVPPLNVPDIGWGITFGPRVPAFAISPWVPAKSVSHEVFDHTSILTTIRKRFLPPNEAINLGPRVTNNANDLGSLLSLKKPRESIVKIPDVNFEFKLVPYQMKLPSAKMNDFHETLFGLRILLGYPPK